MSKGNSTGAWAVTLVRAGYGVALVCAPRALIKLTGDPVAGERGWGCAATGQWAGLRGGAGAGGSASGAGGADRRGPSR